MKNKREDKKYLEICDKIEVYFDRCITKDCNTLHECVERINWIKDFYTKLKGVN